MANATNWINTAAITQPHTEPAGPEYAKLYPSVDAIDRSSPSTEKDTENEDHIESSLLNSCLYPSATKTSSSLSAV